MSKWIVYSKEDNEVYGTYYSYRQAKKLAKHIGRNWYWPESVIGVERVHSVRGWKTFNTLVDF